jgi:hypothetical protein
VLYQQIYYETYAKIGLKIWTLKYNIFGGECDSKKETSTHPPHLRFGAINGEKQQLVTKKPVEAQDIKKIHLCILQ